MGGTDSSISGPFSKSRDIQIHVYHHWKAVQTYFNNALSTCELYCYPIMSRTDLVKMCKLEERHEISNNVVCATIKASDQPAHTRSLIRAFASRLNTL